MSLLLDHEMPRRLACASRSRLAAPIRAMAFALLAATISACGDDHVAVATVNVTPPTASIELGATSQLTAATLDAKGTVLTRAVTWSTSNSSIAIVTNGLVTGVSPGNAVITASSEGKSGSADITVMPPPVATVTITPSAPTMVEADTLHLKAELKGNNGAILTGRTVQWGSASPSVATVNNTTGIVTGVQPGTAVITATSEGKAANVTVTVTMSPCNVNLANPIVSGTPLSGTLQAGDCPWVEQTWADIYKFDLATTTNIDVLLRSTAFDAFLYIFARNALGELVVFAYDDDSGANVDGTNAHDARLTGLMPAGTHYIVANSYETATGAYTLTYTAPFAGTMAQAAAIFSPKPALKLERVSPDELRLLRSTIRLPKR